MIIKFVTVTVRAYDEHGYQKDLLIQDQEQVRISDVRMGQGLRGLTIDPKDFPEMVKFEIIVRES